MQWTVPSAGCLVYLYSRDEHCDLQGWMEPSLAPRSTSAICEGVAVCAESKILQIARHNLVHSRARWSETLFWKSELWTKETDILHPSCRWSTWLLSNSVSSLGCCTHKSWLGFASVCGGEFLVSQSDCKSTCEAYKQSYGTWLTWALGNHWKLQEVQG